MNLFSTDVGPLSDADAALGQALADVATIGIIHQRANQEQADVNQQLQHALESRIIIEQAKGFLAERHQLPSMALSSCSVSTPGATVHASATLQCK